jgi:hypothetical protein
MDPSVLGVDCGPAIMRAGPCRDIGQLADHAG